VDLARENSFPPLSPDPGVCLVHPWGEGESGFGWGRLGAIFHHCFYFESWFLLLIYSYSLSSIKDVMTIDLWNDFSFIRSSKRRRSEHGDLPHFNNLTSQYPILLSLAENLSTLDLVNLGLASRTTWNHVSAPKAPLRLRKAVVKTAIRCEGLHIQPRPQSPHQGTPYILACPSSQMAMVRPCEGCGVGICEVSHGFPIDDISKFANVDTSDLPLQPNQRRNAHLHPQTPLVLSLSLGLAS
jgi:hypothetical protein